MIRPSDYDQKYHFGPKMLEYGRKKLNEKESYNSDLKWLPFMSCKIGLSSKISLKWIKNRVYLVLWQRKILRLKRLYRLFDNIYISKAYNIMRL